MAALDGTEMNVVDEIRMLLDNAIKQRRGSTKEKELPTVMQRSLQKQGALKEFQQNISEEPLARLGMQYVKSIRENEMPARTGMQGQYERMKNKITLLPPSKFAPGMTTARVLPHELKHAGIQALVTPDEPDPYLSMYRQLNNERLTWSGNEEERAISQSGHDRGYDNSYPDTRDPTNNNYEDPTRARWVAEGLDDMALRALNAKGQAPDWVPSNILPNNPIGTTGDDSQSIHLRTPRFLRDLMETGAEKTVFLPNAEFGANSPYLPGSYRAESARLRGGSNLLRDALARRIKNEQ